MTTLTDLNSPESPCEIKKVRCVSFGLFNVDHIRRLSVCEVSSADLYVDGVPNEGGLHDLRMGTTDFNLTCKTCNMDHRTCPGHFGHIELHKPVYNIGFLNTVLTILRCVCYSCSRIIAHPEDKKFLRACKIRNAQQRLAKIMAIARTAAVCQTIVMPDGTTVGCNAPQPLYRRDNIEIQVDFSRSCSEEEKLRMDGDTRRSFTADEANNVLRKITLNDARLLGFDTEVSRPQWLLIHALLVVPPCVRPPVQFGSDRSEDDLTAKLNDILMVNEQLAKFEAKGAASHAIAESHSLLQYHIATFMNNELPGLPVATTRSKKPIKSIRERLKGKEGRLRGNLMGKRVDFSARTVITGDPNIGIDQVGVPRSIAINLTFPENVTHANLDELRKAVANGPTRWPGANYVTRNDGVRFDLRHCAGSSSAVQLEVGYKVERHLRDGDYVLFNRQPSLHKMSIMGHRVKVLPYNTFRVNLSVTSPYNADFDGDEMNLHVAQSHETRAEIKHICLVQHQIVSPQANKPVMGIVQDTLLGMTKMTSRNSFIDTKLLMTLCLFIDKWDGVIPEPAILKPERLWTGKQVFTMILRNGNSDFTNLNANAGANVLSMGHKVVAGPEHLSLIRDSNVYIRGDNPWLSSNDGKVVIQNGELICGIIDKRTVGATAGGLIHVLWHMCGSDHTREFLSTAQKTVNNWLITEGLTTGVSDIVIPDSTAADVHKTLLGANQKVESLIEDARNGQLETQPGKGLLESFENRVNSELNHAREAAGRVAAAPLTDSNNLIAMVNAGSKGSTINISQIMACVGQQNVEGKRIPFGFNQRSLPHFSKFDYSPESRGFVSNSYLSGLAPHELFFHAMGGREGIIDTACKTSETGYIQRRLVKAMEDVMVTYDRSVRNSNGEIVQFLYGEDGIRGEYIEAQVFEIMTMTKPELEKHFKHDLTDPNYGVGWLNPQIAADLRYSLDDSELSREFTNLEIGQRRLCTEVFTDGESKQHLPVNISRIISIAQSMFGLSDIGTMSPVDVFQKVEDMLNNLQLLPTGSKIIDDARQNALSLFTIHVRTHLNSRKVLQYHRLGLEALNWVLEEVAAAYHRSLAQPGEVTGALAAQSIGEPATQMTLNTFHFAGVGSKNVTLGVPRLRELINVAPTVATPSLTIFLDGEAATDAAAAKEVQSRIEYTTLGRFIDTAQIVYDPQPNTSRLDADREWLEDYFSLNELEDGYYDHLSPWVLRIILQEKLITEGLTIGEVGHKIKSEFAPLQMTVIWTDDNSDLLVLRLRPQLRSAKTITSVVSDSQSDETNSAETVELLNQIMRGVLPDLPLRGVVGINKVYMREDRRTEYDALSGSLTTRKGKWVLDTDGVNLRGVMPVEGVLASRSVSNSVKEVLEVLGIEAARKSLLSEIRAVISFDGSYVNYRHLATLCDVMTQKGTLMPITRNGINRVDKGVLAKSSFEETVEILMAASAFGDCDYLKGVTENVIFGQLGTFGTGICDIMLDDSRLMDPCTNFDTNYANGLPEVGEFTGILDAPHDASANFAEVPFSPFSPLSDVEHGVLGICSPSALSPMQGVFSPMQQAFSPQGPTLLSPMGSPSYFSPQSPLCSPSYAMASPSMSVMSPTGRYCRTSPLSGAYSPTSPGMLMSPTYSPTSPVLMSPVYSPTSPMAGGNHPNYSPTSPVHGIQSPMAGASILSPMFNPASPNYSRAVGQPSILSPGSPAFGMGGYNPQSPGAYSPSANCYSPTGITASQDIERTAPMSPGAAQSPRYDSFMYSGFDFKEN